MATDYGLGAMTGVLPTVVVAGAATMIAEKMFRGRESEPRRRRSSRSKKSSRRPSSGLSFGNFSNLGL